MNVRTGSPQDLPALRLLDPLLRTEPDRMALVQSALLEDRCIVASDGEEVLGFVVTTNRAFFNQDFVPLLVVSSTSRRSGIGTKLLQAAQDHCKGSKLFTSTNRSNQAAQSLFGKCGFVQSGHIENLDVGDHEVVYYKPNRRGA